MNAAQSESLFTIHLTRVIRAPRDRVFEAWVNPDLRRQWWHHGNGLSVCDLDPRPGGRYRMVQIGGCEEEHDVPANFEWVMAGEFVEVVRPSRIVFTWNVNHSPPVVNNRVSIDLIEVPGGTELRLTHEGRLTPEMRDGTREGWTRLVASIADLLERN